jgi:hypothetical protein
MNYTIKPFDQFGLLKLNHNSESVIQLLGTEYNLTDLSPYPGFQFFYPALSLKIAFDKNKTVEGIFIYYENPEFHKVFLFDKSLFEMSYLSIKKEFETHKMLEDLETIVLIELGITIYFKDEKESNPHPEEIGLFRKDLKNEYLRLYSK